MPRARPRAGSSLASNLYGDHGVVLIRDANTTIGNCRHTPEGGIEHIFVNPAYRRRGHGRRLLAEVQRRAGRRGAPLDPIAPPARRFFGLDASVPGPQSTPSMLQLT